MVIRAWILVSWANISKGKGTSSSNLKVSSRRDQTRLLSAFLFLKSGLKLEQVFLLKSLAVVSCLVFSYCFKYDFSDRVPVGWSASACAVKVCLSFSESLKEAIVILSSSGKTETMLQDFSFDLDFFESHYLSWARSWWTHMISPVFSVKGARPLSSCCLAEGLFISSRALGIGGDPLGTVTFGIVPNSRVIMFVVTSFFWL